MPQLDASLRNGFGRLRTAFVAPHVDYVLSREMASGGFAGRRGGADIYYTDFALRVLVANGGPREAAQRCVPLLEAAVQRDPFDATELFNRSNALRSLAAFDLSPDIDFMGLEEKNLVDFDTLAETFFYDHRSQGAYALFLLSLCGEQVIGHPFRHANTEAILHTLECPGGGFSERPFSSDPQTNATAACLATARMAGIEDTIDRPGAVDYLSSMQSTDGGFRAHAGIPHGDLLTTFSVLALQCVTGHPLVARPADLARFVRSARHGGGGFGACPGDAPDIEFTWYGLASTALLRAQADRDALVNRQTTSSDTHS